MLPNPSNWSFEEWSEILRAYEGKMVRVEFEGKLYSKGRPPKWFNAPGWIKRMLTWDTIIPINPPAQDFDEGDVKFDIAFGPKVFGLSAVAISAREDAGFVTVQVIAAGYQVLQFEGDINDEPYIQKIKWSAAGQKLEGVLTVTLE